LAHSRVSGLVILAALASAVALWLPAAARADTEPSFTSGPVIMGNAFVGSTLTAAAAWTGDPPIAVKYSWGRCPPTSNTCKRIDGADAAVYTVAAADLGSRLAVEVQLKNKEDEIRATSPPTAVVTAQPPPAPPPPTPAPAPPAQAPGSPAPAPLVTIAPAVISAPSATRASRPALLRPFPVVRIRGYFAPNGARITLLSVRGPHSAQISVRCVGPGCPVATLALPSAPARLHPFERFLPAGTRLEISVARPGRVGKYASFLIRAHRAPLRTDRCLLPGRSRPTRCPAS
jgi:hypothetical protein